MRSCCHIKITLALFAILGSCDALNRDLVIKVTAKTPDGSPVTGASVLLDGKIAGETNAFGSVQLHARFKNASRHQVTVSKSDDSYYYAPHVESLKITDDTPNEISVASVMYLVPKPKKNANRPDGKTARPEPEMVVATNATNDEPNELPLFAPLPDYNEAPQQGSDARGDSSIITAHIYAGRMPIAKARVIWQDKNHSVECHSNERGRCLLEIPEATPAGGSLIIMADGYQSQYERSPGKDKDNLRVSLKPGSNFVLRLTKKSLWSAEPLAAVKLTDGYETTTSDGDGIAIIQNSGDRSPERHLRVNADGSKAFRDIKISELNPAGINEIPFASTDALTWRSIKVTYPKISPEAMALLNAPIPLPGIFAGTQDAAKNSVATVAENEFATADSELVITPLIIRKSGSYYISAHYRDAHGLHHKAGSDQLVSDTSQIGPWVSALHQSIKTAIEHAPSPAIVVRSTPSELEISGSNLPEASKFNPEKGLKVAVGLKSQILPVTSASKTNNGLRLRSTAIDQLTGSNRPWSLIGSPAWIVSNAPGEAFDLSSYQSLNPEFAAVSAARRHLSEGNIQESLRILGESPKLEKRAEALNLRHKILVKSGKIDEFRRDMYEIIEHGRRQNQTQRAVAAEINISRIQAESLPVLSGDIDLESRFADLISRCSNLQSEAQISDPLTLVNLRYALIVASRKRAQVAGDLIAIATLKSDLDKLVRDIQTSPDNAEWKKPWLQTALNERQFIEFNERDDKKQGI